jgi:hypothetical protein
VRVQRPIDTRRRTVFLRVLTETGSVAAASRAATPWAKCKAPTAAWRDLRKRDPEFDLACVEALEQFDASWEVELVRRARDGCQRPIVSGGKVVTTVVEYSDNLLLALAKARKPEVYDPAQRVKVDASVSGGVLLIPGVAGSPAEWTTIAAQAKEVQAQARLEYEEALRIEGPGGG